MIQHLCLPKGNESLGSILNDVPLGFMDNILNYPISKKNPQNPLGKWVNNVE